MLTCSASLRRYNREGDLLFSAAKVHSHLSVAMSNSGVVHLVAGRRSQAVDATHQTDMRMPVLRSCPRCAASPEGALGAEASQPPVTSSSMCQGAVHRRLMRCAGWRVPSCDVPRGHWRADRHVHGPSGRRGVPVNNTCALTPLCPIVHVRHLVYLVASLLALATVPWWCQHLWLHTVNLAALPCPRLRSACSRLEVAAERGARQ